ncbi:MAG: hypothetical protein WD489_08705 [Rhodovibrionaceae bacterium]
MNLEFTLLALLGGFVVAAASHYKAGQPFDPNRPRLFPYRGLEVLAIFVCALLLVHVLALFTGWDIQGGSIGKRGIISFQ